MYATTKAEVKEVNGEGGQGCVGRHIDALSPHAMGHRTQHPPKEAQRYFRSNNNHRWELSNSWFTVASAKRYQKNLSLHIYTIPPMDRRKVTEDLGCMHLLRGRLFRRLLICRTKHFMASEVCPKARASRDIWPHKCRSVLKGA